MQVMKTMLSGLIACGLLATLGLAQGSTSISWVEVRTDLYTRVPGTGVQVDWSGGDFDGTTALTGRTDSFDLPVAETAVVTLQQTRTALGSTVGQVVTAIASPYTEDLSYEGFCYTVPEARVTDFTAAALTTHGGLHEDEHSVGWYAYPEFPAIADYSFSAGVASLRDIPQVEAYFAYRSRAPQEDYSQGLLFRVSSDADLDGHSMVIAINALDHGYTNPKAVVVQFAGVATPTAFANVVAKANGHVFVRLDGLLPAGDTLVLLKEATQEYSVAYSAQSSSADDAGGGNGFTACEPQGLNNENGQYCSVPPNNGALSEPDSDCGATMYECGANDKEARIVPAWVGPPPCNDSGISTSVRICWDISGGVEVGFNLGPVVELDLNGQITRVRCATVSVGECHCVGSWTCEWSQSQCWEICREHVVWKDGQFQTLQYHSRKVQKASGSKAVEQTTSCPIPDCGGGSQ